MKKFYLILLMGVVAFLAIPAMAKPIINEAAPDFAVVDSRGKTISLQNFKGKTVILEWTNHQCPFVKKHYQSHNMQSLQKKYSAADTVWLSVISSAKGKQGYVTANKANELSVSRGATPTHILLDASGELGQAYGAKTTPHMYIIDAQGILRYKGAIDSIRSSDPADIQKATNYVVQAMDELASGEPVSQPVTKAYGCSVKY